MIRYHLDQHVDSAVARGLRLRGIDATTTADAGLQDSEDFEHIAFALKERRVIFTQDRDFLRHHATGGEHAGIAYAAQGSRTVGEIIAYLELIHQCLDVEDMHGHGDRILIPIQIGCLRGIRCSMRLFFVCLSNFLSKCRV